MLGAPVFAKGHLRKYAEMVGVDVDDIMTDYYQMNRSTGTPPVVGLTAQHGAGAQSRSCGLRRLSLCW